MMDQCQSARAVHNLVCLAHTIAHTMRDEPKGSLDRLRRLLYDAGEEVCELLLQERRKHENVTELVEPD